MADLEYIELHPVGDGTYLGIAPVTRTDGRQPTYTASSGIIALQVTGRIDGPFIGRIYDFPSDTWSDAPPTPPTPPPDPLPIPAEPDPTGIDKIWNEETSLHTADGSMGRVLDDLGAGYRPVFSIITDSLAAIGQTDIVNVSETGKLVSFGAFISVPVSGVNPVSVLEIAVDGQVQTTMKMWDGAPTWSGEGIGMFGSPLNFGSLKYSKSLRVSHDIAIAAGGGEVKLGVWRGVKV